MTALGQSPHDLHGQQINSLSVLSKEKHHSGRPGWRVRCECGIEFVLPTYKLTSKPQQQSCWDCSRIEPRNVKHGLCNNRTGAFWSWQAMRGRCLTESHKSYHNYGGRGITICERWNDFNNFLADMGERPPGMTLDRWPDVNGNYDPGNCRWATPVQQSANRRISIGNA